MMYHEELVNRTIDFKKEHGTIKLLNIVLPRQQVARLAALQLADKVKNEEYRIVDRESSGHSPSFFLIDSDAQPFAILKQSLPEFYCSFKKFLPAMPLNAAVWEHELIAFEQDRQFHLDHVPASLAARFLYQGKPVNGIIQDFIPNSKDGTAFYNPEGAHLLNSIPKNTVQKAALSGFFKGLTGGQVSNYLIQDRTIYEIDLETLLLPYNRLADVPDLVVSDDLPTKESLNSLILCRMWILGLNQSGEAFAPEVLQSWAQPNLLTSLSQYQKEASDYSRIDQKAWQAQYERVEQIQALIKNELVKSYPTLTPRDLYFTLFGGEHLWKIAQEKRYPAMIAFNNLISDPYQYLLKDFSNPQSIPVSRRLEEPKENTQEAIDIMNFYRIMEGYSKV